MQNEPPSHHSSTQRDNRQWVAARPQRVKPIDLDLLSRMYILVYIRRTSTCRSHNTFRNGATARPYDCQKSSSRQQTSNLVKQWLLIYAVRLSCLRLPPVIQNAC